MLAAAGWASHLQQHHLLLPAECTRLEASNHLQQAAAAAVCRALICNPAH
jgi:hypothetical protein